MDRGLVYRLSLRDFFSQKMLGATNRTRDLDTSVGKLNRTLSMAGRAIGGYFAFSAIKDAGDQILQSTANMQSFENAIKAAAGSEMAGNSNLQFFNQQVDRLGLNLQAAQQGYKTFQGSVMGTNLEGEKANKIFRQVSEASTVLGLSAEQTEGSFLALGQMISKGTVQAEELRGQLAERIPGAFQIGARAMGVSTEKLGEMMKEGLVKADDFLEKFGNELEKQFGGKLENATHSLRSNLNRWDNEWEKLRINVGNSQSNMLSGTISWAAGMMKATNEGFSAMNRMQQVLDRDKLGFAWQEKLNYYLTLGSTNFDRFTGGLASNKEFQASLQSMYVEPSGRDRQTALASQSGLYRLRAGHHRSFANKEISELEYKRGVALISSALEQVTANVKISKSKIASEGLKDSNKNQGVATIGSATEVFGAKPQNINITIHGGLVAKQEFHTSTITESAPQVKAQMSKVILEALNDANNMGR